MTDDNLIFPHGMEVILPLNKDEDAWFQSKMEKLPYKSSSYYLTLAAKSPAVRTQIIPQKAELEILDYEDNDPLSEKKYSPIPRMVHRYPNRVAILLTDRCAAHCRHCFRRSFTGKGLADLKSDSMGDMLSYIKSKPEVKEVLLTGGDPLMIPQDRLLGIMQALRSIRPDIILRLASRIPVVLPGRISLELAEKLSELGPVWFVMQFNHPDELTDESKQALAILRKAGIPMLNQAVLLKGVNDNSEVLAELFQSLLIHGVKPYYLFQGDLARGTSHFRVPLEKGWQIMEELRLKVSGLALPRYAVDLPGGGGKIPLDQSLLIREEADAYIFRNGDGSEYAYPREDSNA